MKNLLSFLACVACHITFAQTHFAPDKIARLKDEIIREIESQSVLAQQINDVLFSYSELGFQEYETQAYLTQLLEKNAFKIQNGIANMPTSWTATSGSGKPVISYATVRPDQREAVEKLTRKH